MTRNPVLPYLWYPLFLAAAAAAFGAALSHGGHLLVALYVPIAVVALAIVGLELVDPERLDWRPRWRDVRADALFLALVQVLLPRALAALVVLLAADWSHVQGPNRWWPHHWPLAVQTILMVLLVDFTRYWLHRACHTWTPLWRLHEVHHSPDILYSLNTARFHPLEKVLHFCLDTVPFLLLGVAPEVIAGYFLLYAVNGFFQHSNVRLRYGFLNYVVGSAQTHRWHHARDPRTACCNFSNTTIVWDLVFGTWYLPRDRALDIGIPDRSYPTGFWSQMLAPLRRTGLARAFANLAIRLQLRLTSLLWRGKIAAAARDPMARQCALLAQIVQRNRNTTFGLDHGFDHIHNYADFAARVPVREYEGLRAYIDAEIEHSDAALTTQPPLRYLRTSGTTGRPKDVPLTPDHLRRLRSIHRLSVAAQARACPQAFDGSILAITSPASEGTLANGKPYGSASGVVAGSTPAVIQEKFVVPAAVLGIADSRVKVLLILRLALARADITYLGTANASTLLVLMRLYREHEPALLRDLREGGFFLNASVPADVLAAVIKRLEPDPARAEQIEALRRSRPALRIADLWPRLRLVVTWTGGSAGVSIAALKAELSADTRILELGYLASEFRGTITLGRRAGSGLPTFDTHFFEFVERDKWDAEQPEFLTLDRLRKGVDYYVIVTTPSGLYRYFINDLVRVTGHLHRMPLLQFRQKGKGVTSITGEKLYEAQVLAAVRHAMAQLVHAQRFVIMLADEAANRYVLYVEVDAGAGATPAAETLAQAVDAQLQALNLEYRGKRESARLAPLVAHWLAPGTEEAYRNECVRQGQREGQFKPVALAYRNKFAFDLDAHIQESRA